MSNEAVNGVNIPSIQSKKITFKGTQPAMQGVSIPQEALANDMYVPSTPMQGIDKDKVKDQVDNSYIANRAKASADADPRVTTALTLGTWYGINAGMNKLTPHMEGDYNKTFLNKLDRVGDTFATKTWVGRNLEKTFRWFDKFTEKLAQKSKIVYTLRNHATSPEWSFARIPGKGMEGFLSQDTENIVEEFLKPIANKDGMSIFGRNITKNKNLFQKLENYGLKQSEINTFIQSLAGKPFNEQAMALQIKELELLGAKPIIIARAKAGKINSNTLAKVTSHLKAQALGFRNLKEYQQLKGNFIDNPDKVIKMLEKISKDHPDWKVSIWRNNGGFFTKLKNHLFGRTVKFSEYRNKYYAITGKGAHTKIGKMLNKAFAWMVEGGTNRFAGGKFAVFMQATIFADMLYHTFKAPKGEKGKTLIERAVNDFSYFIGLTLGIIGMHKVGGFKYAGLDKDGVKAYKDALKVFNEQVKNHAFADKKAYKAAKKALKDSLGGSNIKNPITKALHYIGKAINMGNERILSYRSTKKWNMNLFRKLFNGNLLGVPLRIAIPMAIVTPFIVKHATQACHKIFGRPTNSVLDEDQEIPEATQTNQPNPTQAMTQGATVTNGKNPANLGRKPEYKKPEDYASDSNLIKMTMTGKNNPQKPTRTYVPSPDCQIKGMEPKRTYIPNPAGMVQQGPDLTAADNAMARADMAEKMINETLASLNKPL